MKSITSRSNALVSEFRQLASAPDTSGMRLLLDGAHLVGEARDSGLTFACVAISVAALEEGAEAATLAHSLDAAGQPVVTVTDPVLRALSPVRHPSGMVAIALRAVPPGNLLVSSSQALFLVVADVQDPGNLGALIRVAEAGGVSQVVVCGTSAHPYGWRALRGSMGSALRLPIAQFSSTSDALRSLSSSKTRLVAAVPRGGRQPDEVTWTGRIAVVLGSEGAGLDHRHVEQCDELVTIPMSPQVESLNVASAAAILVYAARRQRSPLEVSRTSLNQTI